jgi:hypothetical protein
MPMLDEEEFSAVTEKRNSNQSLRQNVQAMLDEYEAITDFHETNLNAIFHHRLAIYGPPCKQCGRPLRTPQAKLCGSCMFPL